MNQPTDKLPREPKMGSDARGLYEIMIDDAKWFVSKPDDDGEDEAVCWGVASSVAADADRKIAALARKLAVARAALEAVCRNDKSPIYEYGEKNALGHPPREPGQRWNTPTELARRALAEIGGTDAHS